MKFGKLYKYTGKRFASIVLDGWTKPCVYLGEEIVDRLDGVGVKIINHKFLLSNGKIGHADKNIIPQFSEIK